MCSIYRYRSPRRVLLLCAVLVIAYVDRSHVIHVPQKIFEQFTNMKYVPANSKAITAFSSMMVLEENHQLNTRCTEAKHRKEFLVVHSYVCKADWLWLTCLKPETSFGIRFNFFRFFFFYFYIFFCWTHRVEKSETIINKNIHIHWIARARMRVCTIKIHFLCGKNE